jgi:hypothetical protein
VCQVLQDGDGVVCRRVVHDQHFEVVRSERLFLEMREEMTQER